MIEKLIRRLNFFSELTYEDRAWLQTRSLQIRKFEKRTEFIGRNENHGLSYFIVDGWVVRYDNTRESDQITSIYVTGDFIDLSYSKFRQLESRFVAFESTELVLIPHTLVRAMVARLSIAQALLSASLVETNMLRVWLTNIGKRDAANRVAHLICELQTRLMINVGTKDLEFRFPLTQTQLADAVALTPVHMNRTLKNLREAGLAEVSQGRIMIKDHAGLHGMVRFDPGYLYPARR